MATLRTIEVKSSGGDYTSLASAEAGEQGDITLATGSDEIVRFECSSLADTSAVTITGWTTAAGNYIQVIAIAGEHHAGVWDASKYRLSVSSAFGNALLISEDYVRVEYLQVEQTHATGRPPIRVASTANDSASDIQIAACLIRNASTNVASNTGSNLSLESGKVMVTNTASYSAGACGLLAAGSTAVANNCTLAANGTYGAERSSGSLALTNVYSGGNGTDDYSGTITRTTCAHSSATVFTGSTASVAHSTANFTNVTAGSEDYHRTPGSALAAAGTNLSSDFTTDIDGETRPSVGPWDIGADELVSAGGFQAAWASGCNVIICMGH